MSKTPKGLTPKELDEIETMAGLGMKFEDIARMKGMCLDTLKKYAREPLNRGKAKAKAAVMQTAYKMAVSGKYPAMTMFWLKTQASWRENMPEEDATKDKLSGGVDAFLQKSIEQLKNGQLDPKVASVIGSLTNILLKANEQAELKQRLDTLESILAVQPKAHDSLLDRPLEEIGAIEFISGLDE